MYRDYTLNIKFCQEFVIRSIWCTFDLALVPGFCSNTSTSSSAIRYCTNNKTNSLKLEAHSRNTMKQNLIKLLQLRYRYTFTLISYLWLVWRAEFLTLPVETCRKLLCHLLKRNNKTFIHFIVHLMKERKRKILANNFLYVYVTYKLLWGIKKYNIWIYLYRQYL